METELAHIPCHIPGCDSPCYVLPQGRGLSLHAGRQPPGKVPTGVPREAGEEHLEQNNFRRGSVAGAQGGRSCFPATFFFWNVSRWVAG